MAYQGNNVVLYYLQTTTDLVLNLDFFHYVDLRQALRVLAIELMRCLWRLNRIIYVPDIDYEGRGCERIEPSYGYDLATAEMVTNWATFAGYLPLSPLGVGVGEHMSHENLERLVLWVWEDLAMVFGPMDEVEWPSQSIPQSVKTVIARFYAVVDSDEPSCGQQLAETVFAKDGEFVVNKRSMKGYEEIAEWRVGGESVVLREHKVHKVYISDEQGDDLLMTGTLMLESNIGLTAESPFCARCVVEDVDCKAPRVAYWQIWMDTTPFYDLGILRNPASKVTNGILDTIGGR
ncbi:hypothetical protein LTR08_003444 [Meristemomyces frigidus]|nr:hypothetical protein LTR08_003444 [Meristemomyces frigidus]